MKLYLLYTSLLVLVSGAILCKLCCSRTNTSVSTVDIIEEDLLGIMARRCDAAMSSAKDSREFGFKQYSPLEEEPNAVFS